MADAPEKFSWLVRFGYAGRGVVYLLLGWLALGTRARVDAGNQAVFDMLQDLPLGMKHSAGGSQAKAAVHSALDWSLGSVAVGLVGVGFVIGAGAQVRQATTGHFMHHVSQRAPAWVEWLGRAGYAARAVVFAIVGWSLMRAAWFHHSRDAKGLGEALVSLRASGPLYRGGHRPDAVRRLQPDCGSLPHRSPR